MRQNHKSITGTARNCKRNNTDIITRKKVYTKESLLSINPGIKLDINTIECINCHTSFRDNTLMAFILPCYHIFCENCSRTFEQLFLHVEKKDNVLVSWFYCPDANCDRMCLIPISCLAQVPRPVDEKGVRKNKIPDLISKWKRPFSN